MIIALEADASVTSVSEIAPTEPWIISSLTSSVDSRASASASASTEPFTSPLRITLRSLTSPAAIRWLKSSSETRLVF